MAFYPLHQKRRPLTWGTAWIVSFCFMLLPGSVMILYGFYADYRDKPSLQWPKVSGALVQCGQVFHKGYGLHHDSYYNVAVTYTYAVNGRSYTGHRIALWSEDMWCVDGKRSSAFAATHPAGSQTDVYYDPNNPENALLIPGPATAYNRLFKICGGLTFISGILFVLVLRPRLKRIKADLQLQENQEKRC